MTGMRPRICSTSISDESWRYGSLFTSDLLTFTPYSTREIKRAHSTAKKSRARKYGHGNAAPLRQFGDFLVEVRESGLERFAMIGVRCGFEIVGDPGSGQLQVVSLLFALELFIGLGATAGVALG